MKFTLCEAPALLPGTEEIGKLVGFDLGEGGIVIRPVKEEVPTLTLDFDGTCAEIHYQEKCQFFRALGLLVEHIGYGESAIHIRQTPQFTMNGVMFDMCQDNAAFRQDKMKEILCRMALMGLNTVMLYLEDNYEVPEEPYFGYMRPLYTQKMLRELDDYAFALGIEMIPCIQTLAHLRNMLRWNVYASVRDDYDCLLIGDERTYEILDHLIKAAIAPFRTKKIHIGMDEADHLGRGRTLLRDGYRTRVDLMSEHLGKVDAILRKYGLEPMMWSDMFFKSYGEQVYEQLIPVPQEVRDSVPKGMRCVYWYYGATLSDEQFAHQLSLTEKTVFAGGCWAWLGWGLAYRFTSRAVSHTLSLCRRFGVKEVFMTTWGDHGTEAPITVNLFGAQLYAENGYSDHAPDEETLARRFAFCAGANLADFAALDRFDHFPMVQETSPAVNPSQYLTWQDILTGLFDYHVRDLPLDEHYAALARDLADAPARNPGFAAEFHLWASVADMLSVKAKIGVHLTEAYQSGNRERLRHLVDDVLTGLYKKVQDLHEEHRAYWFSVYQPLGWDVFDMRYGALEARIMSAIRQIRAYLDGTLCSLPELEVQRLSFTGEDTLPVWVNRHYQASTPSLP